MAPNWPAQRSETTGFRRLGASARVKRVVDFVEKHSGGVVEVVKWELSANRART
jgi:hypothetical protein